MLITIAGVPEPISAVAAIAVDGSAVVAASLGVRASETGSDRGGQGGDRYNCNRAEEKLLGNLGALLDGGGGGGDRHGKRTLGWGV